MAKLENSFVAAVKEFHANCEYHHSTAPSVADPARRALWHRLISEESSELLEALEGADLLKVADGLGDLIYVCVGASLAFGLPIEAIFDEIQRSNLTKIRNLASTERRDDGKILRGADYSPPDLEMVLLKYTQSRVRAAE